LFRPLDRDVRGWVGAIEGDRVVHLAAQSLASYFTGGGSAREHDEYALEDVRFLAPVPRPASVRDFYAFEDHIRNAARVLDRPGVPDEWYELAGLLLLEPGGHLRAGGRNPVSGRLGGARLRARGRGRDRGPRARSAGSRS
jgi:hypothetical protein